MSAFADSGWSDKFPGIAKRMRMKLFLDLDGSDATLDALCYLEESLEDPSAKVIKAWERFLSKAFSSKS